MKKLIAIFALILTIVAVWWLSKPKIDETKTEDNSLTTIDEELKTTELEDFDQEIQELDQSINQL